MRTRIALALMFVICVDQSIVFAQQPTVKADDLAAVVDLLGDIQADVNKVDAMLSNKFEVDARTMERIEAATGRIEAAIANFGKQAAQQVDPVTGKPIDSGPGWFQRWMVGRVLPFAATVYLTYMATKSGQDNTNGGSK